MPDPLSVPSSACVLRTTLTWHSSWSGRPIAICIYNMQAFHAETMIAHFLQHRNRTPLLYHVVSLNMKRKLANTPGTSRATESCIVKKNHAFIHAEVRSTGLHGSAANARRDTDCQIALQGAVKLHWLHWLSVNPGWPGCLRLCVKGNGGSHCIAPRPSRARCRSP